MIKFKRVYDITGYLAQEKLAQVSGIYEKAFPYHPTYSAKIAKLMRNQVKKHYEIFLIVAEGSKGRVLGFTLFFYFSDLKLAYLDYIASDPSRSARGLGAALYEVTRETLIRKSCQGLLMDVPPDDEKLLVEKKTIDTNKKRMRFYENFGAKPITGTLYERLETKANAGYFTYLVYDPLKRKTKLKTSELKGIIQEILHVKADMLPSHPKVKKILASIEDGSFQVRENRYDPDLIIDAKLKAQLTEVDIVLTDETHTIHHLQERGYVERPARIDAIKKGLEGLTLQYHKVKKHPLTLIKEVHDKELINLFQKAEKELTSHKPLYPDVYPKGVFERLPKDISLRAGFFTIDSFTPLTSNVYKAALNSVNSALTGVDLILKDSPLVYSVCRPPGHHAEKKFFGGFCYFNNAAIAAHALSKHGKVAFLDIDYHHGNGSQDIFYDRNDVYFISIHGHPSQAYPYYSGYEDETGKGKGKGYNRNFPLYPGVDNKKYMLILNQAMEIFKKFKPKYFVVSAGLDLMKGDPTGTFVIDNAGMKMIGKKLAGLGVPTLLVQEGGYSLTNLKSGVRNLLLGISEML